MKKLNTKGFTLIELLAVITIMGILMMVAIPTVSRTIENSRKDTFIDTVNQYINGTKNMWAADNLKCGDYLSSAVATGTYYVGVNTKDSSSLPVLLEQGGKSSWGQRDIKGYILIHVQEVGSGGAVTRKVSYYPVLVDGIHGVNVAADGTPFKSVGSSALIAGEKLVRGNLKMTGAVHSKVISSSGTPVVETVIQPDGLTAAGAQDSTNKAVNCVEV